ncbi:MAG: 16S rRNA (cytosine(1402)-N(4))-methyltransferase RsmH [Lentisphaeria bacterium]|nr:16S rRNA (cytosine(1402)-N(4))-methyltransferase RsmH [Lentisphaeria bacterium]
MEFKHQSVLLNEAVSLLTENGGRRFIDGTLGGGGHTRKLLETLPECEVLGIDCDQTALEAAQENLQSFGGRFHAVKGRFSQLEELARDHGWKSVDGVLLDLGVSSPQIDTPERGFSFRFDAPLDMRMDRQSPITAAVLLNTLEERELANILFEYGEERRSRAIARAIVQRRQSRPWERTGELAELLEKVVGRQFQHGLPPATRAFQALRIAVNRELDELQDALDAAMEITGKGARIVVISFHSLEDRMVKNFFRQAALDCVCPPGMPLCVCGKVPSLQVITRKPMIASEQELRGNPRSSCAKLRAAERV